MSKSIVKLNLERELDNGTIETEQVSIKKLKARQITQTLTVVTDILSIVEENDGLRDMLGELFQGAAEFDANNFPDATPEELEEYEEEFKKIKDQEFMMTLVGSFRTLLIKFPTHGFKLVSAMSRVDEELLLDQDLEVVLDILDAVIEVNDLEALIERGKQSFSLGKKALNFRRKQDTNQLNILN